MYINYSILFAQFIISYNKFYEEHEILNKFNIFKSNYQQIQMVNSENNTYQLGINEYADLTQSEWSVKYNSLNFDEVKTCPSFEFTGKSVPASIDWREHGIVTPVRDQGSCGSCWAFAISGATESTWIQTLNSTGLTNLTEYYLSPQELVDCSSSYGNLGCSGGYIDSTFEYIIDNGICLDSQYPYTGQNDPSCSKCSPAVKLGNCYDIPSGNQLALKEAVSIRPVVVCIEADKFVFQFYKSGIISGDECGTSLDHAVLAIGYGDDSSTGMKYWIVKNSWGTGWGADGYVLIERSDMEDDLGVCGIASLPVMAEM